MSQYKEKKKDGQSNYLANIVKKFSKNKKATLCNI